MTLPNGVRFDLKEGEFKMRFIQSDKLALYLKLPEEEILAIAYAAGAVYGLSKIKLISLERMNNFMEHKCKAPGTAIYVQKKFVRMGEGTFIYSIGRQRFVEMARDAGAVYKLSGMVLINLEIFDEYMEQFHA